MTKLVRWGRCELDGCPGKGTRDEHVTSQPMAGADTWRQPTGPSGAHHYATQVATCQRKQTFLSRTTAANAAWILNILGRSLQPYRCAICGDFHLTTRRGA